MTAEFDEGKHPRDAHGRWTSGPGGEDVYKDLTVNSILGAVLTEDRGTRRNEEIAKELNDRGSAALKALGVESGKIETPDKKNPADPRETNILSSAIASEIEDAMVRDQRTAVNWYTSKVDEAMKVATAMHPEMANDANAKFGYTAALAVTSQGETVPNNTRLADLSYETFAKTGRFPTDVSSAAQKMMNSNFDKLNSLIDKMGMEGTRNFLDKEFSVRDLEKMGYKITGENKDAKVYGSAIMGPKIGQGFYQNLNGNYKPLTADMWFMRAWGRLTGTLVGTVPIDKPLARLTAALKEEGQKIPKGQEAMVAKANEIMTAHEKDFRDNREQYDSGQKTKAESTFAADRYLQAVSGIKDQPSSGAQRQHMRDVFAQAQEKLTAAGHPVSIADMQATWWYPEKNLYQRLGSRNTERINTDYAAALKDLAIKKGISPSVIEKATKK